MLPALAHAESQTWQVRSFHPKVVDVAFYSESRKAEWPGGGKVYTITNYNVQTYKLSCIAGEKVCYGAWVRNNDKRYWGRGHGGKQACTNCCFTCDGGKTPVMNLNE